MLLYLGIDVRSRLERSAGAAQRTHEVFLVDRNDQVQEVDQPLKPTVAGEAYAMAVDALHRFIQHLKAESHPT